MIMRKDVSRQVTKGAAAASLLGLLLVLPGIPGQDSKQEQGLRGPQAGRAEQCIDQQIEVRKLSESGEKLYAAKRYEEAIESFEQVLALDPKNGMAHARLGYMHNALGDHDEAARHFEAEVKLGHEPATAIYNLACAATLSGDEGRGLALLEQAVRRGFTNADLMASDADLERLREHEGFASALETSRKSKALRGKLAELNGKQDLEAVAQIHRALLSIATEDGAVQDEGGLALLRMKDCDGALQAFQRQVSLGHQVGRGHYNSACALALSGRNEAALAELELAAKAGLAYAAALKDEDLASLHADARFEAVAKRLAAPETFQKRLEKTVATGDSEDARKSLQALLEDGRESPKTRSWAAFQLGRLQLKSNQAQASIESLRLAIAEGYPAGPAAFYIGVAHASLGETEAALTHFDKSLLLGFAQAEELSRALQVCGQGDSEKGQQLMQRAKELASQIQAKEQQKKALASKAGEKPVEKKVIGPDVARRP